MKILLAFSEDDIYRLFLTFRRNPTNYQKIKEKVLGDGAKVEYLRQLRGKWIFLFAVTIIAAVSSLYPMAAGDWRTVGALAVSWGLFVMAFLVWAFISYRISYRIIKKNEGFFEKFEQKAESCTLLEEFRKSWKA